MIRRRKKRVADVIYDDDTSDDDVIEPKAVLSTTFATSGVRQKSSTNFLASESEVLGTEPDSSKESSTSSTEDNEDVENQAVADFKQAHIDAKVQSLLKLMSKDRFTHTTSNVSESPPCSDDAVSCSSSEGSCETENTACEMAKKSENSVDEKNGQLRSAQLSDQPKKVLVLDGYDGNSSEEERIAIRRELSSMSQKEIQKLKASIIDHKVVVRPNKILSRKSCFKRNNKNCPREVTSKRPVKRVRDVVGLKSEDKRETRDPRFDSLCGDFHEKQFRDGYKFVDDIKSKELKCLKVQLTEEEDPDQVKRIKYLIQRMENQHRERDKIDKRKRAIMEEKRLNRKLVQEGKTPQYVRKKDRQMQDLVEKYESLKKNGRLKNYMMKRSKKTMAKDRKRFKGNLD